MGAEFFGGRTEEIFVEMVDMERRAGTSTLLAGMVVVVFREWP